MPDITDTTIDGNDVNKKRYEKGDSSFEYKFYHPSQGSNNEDAATSKWKLVFRENLHEEARLSRYICKNSKRKNKKRPEQKQAEKDRAAFAQECSDRGEPFPENYPAWQPPLRKHAVSKSHPLWGWVVSYTGPNGSEIIAHPSTKTKSFIPLNENSPDVVYGHYDDEGNIFSAPALFGGRFKIAKVISQYSD